MTDLSKDSGLVLGETAGLESSESKESSIEFVASTKVFQAALSSALRAVSSRVSHPILSGVKLSVQRGVGTKDGLAILEAFDLEIAIRVWFEAQVFGEGEIVLPAKFLKEVVSKLGVGEIRFKQKGTVVEISQGKTKVKVSSMFADEFPALPEVEKMPIVLDSKAFLGLIDGTIHSVSTNETKQVLCGVHFNVSPGKIEAAATDGYRIAVKTIETESCADVSSEFEFTVPSRSLTELKNLLSKTQAEILSLSIDGVQVKFELEEASLVSRVFEGIYPPYRKLIPETFHTEIVVDTKNLVEVVQRCAPVAEFKKGVVGLDVDPSREMLRVFVDAGDYAIDDEISIKVNRIPSNDRFSFSCNTRYLLDALQTKTAECVILFNDPGSPFILKGSEDASQIDMIMPVFVRA